MLHTTSKYLRPGSGFLVHFFISTFWKRKVSSSMKNRLSVFNLCTCGCACVFTRCLCACACVRVHCCLPNSWSLKLPSRSLTFFLTSFLFSHIRVYNSIIIATIFTERLPWPAEFIWQKSMLLFSTLLLPLPCPEDLSSHECPNCSAL